MNHANGLLSGQLGSVFFIFVTIAGFAALFIPFWIWRIRDEIIKTNKLLEKLVNQNTSSPDQGNEAQKISPYKKTWQCVSCGNDNNKDVVNCSLCGREKLIGQ